MKLDFCQWKCTHRSDVQLSPRKGLSSYAHAWHPLRRVSSFPPSAAAGACALVARWVVSLTAISFAAACTGAGEGAPAVIDVSEEEMMVAMGYTEPDLDDTEEAVVLNEGACPFDRLIVTAHEAYYVTLDGERYGEANLGVDDSRYIDSAIPLSDGDWIVVYGAHNGIARVSPDGEQRWGDLVDASLGDHLLKWGYHHDSAIDGDVLWTMRRQRYTLHKAWADLPDSIRPDPIEELVQLDLESGEVLNAWPMGDLLRELNFRIDVPTDPLHPNRVVPQGDGSVLLSLREVDAVVHIDPLGDGIRHVWQGSFKRQHSPILRNGELSVFDNGGLQAIIYDAATMEPVWRYPVESDVRGDLTFTPCGSVLIADSQAGRAMEVSRDGELLWDYRAESAIMRAVSLDDQSIHHRNSDTDRPNQGRANSQGLLDGSKREK